MHLISSIMGACKVSAMTITGVVEQILDTGMQAENSGVHCGGDVMQFVFLIWLFQQEPLTEHTVVAFNASLAMEQELSMLWLTEDGS